MLGMAMAPASCQTTMTGPKQRPALMSQENGASRNKRWENRNGQIVRKQNCVTMFWHGQEGAARETEAEKETEQQREAGSKDKRCRQFM